MRPALFLFALLMPLAMLMGCRPQGEWHQLEGVVLGTGYHITLNGDLDEGDVALVEAAILGELASLDSHMQVLDGLLEASHLPCLAEPPSGMTNALVRGQLHALAVDRLFGVFDAFGIANAMVELGGVQRASGTNGRHPWRVRLPRSGPDGTPEPVLRLQDAALVTRSAPKLERIVAPGTARSLAVSAVAPSAEQADHLARRLITDAPAATLEHPARIVVLTPEGLEFHIGSALEPLLEY
ncbi:FAD:protein FMN transferase [Halomonas sp.]|uniref:FAD:protein FMN transferase n=1 Tax=Halomonas sp. TaxID=1486246 RepID=UPI00384B9868